MIYVACRFLNGYFSASSDSAVISIDMTKSLEYNWPLISVLEHNIFE